MKRLAAILGVVAALAGLAPGIAQATPLLTLTVSDSIGGSATQQSFSGPGNGSLLNFNFSEDGFSAAGSYFGEPASAGSFSQDVSSISVNSGTASGSVTLDLKFSGLTSANSSMLLNEQSTGHIIPGFGNIASENIQLDINGSQIAKWTGLGLTSNNSVLASVPTSGTFTAEEIVTINLGANTHTSTDNTLNGSAVPEPATLLLLGAGMLGLGLYRSRRGEA
jgi:hypothetical protein